MKSDSDCDFCAWSESVDQLQLYLYETVPDAIVLDDVVLFVEAMRNHFYGRNACDHGCPYLMDPFNCEMIFGCRWTTPTAYEVEGSIGDDVESNCECRTRTDTLTSCFLSRLASLENRF